MTNTQLFMKAGDSLDIPIQFMDKDTGLGLAIDLALMQISASVRDLKGCKLADFEVTPYLDQVIDAGYVLLSISADITNNWSEGTTFFDIKLEQNGKVKHSETVTFTVKRSITQ